MSVETRDLEAALTIAAGLVARHGAAYLPAFFRIEGELKARDDQTAAVARARAIAGQSAAGAPGSG